MNWVHTGRLLCLSALSLSMGCSRPQMTPEVAPEMAPEVTPVVTSEVTPIVSPTTRPVANTTCVARKSFSVNDSASMGDAFVPGQVVLRGFWDYFVLFRGEPFSGTLQFPVATQDSAGRVITGAEGRVVLPGHFEGRVIVSSVDVTCGAVVLQFETPRGSATFRAQFERQNLMTGLLEDIHLGRSVEGLQRKRLAETNIVMSATRR